jgi:hypothetical protein
MNDQDQHWIDATQAWLKTIIIEYSICPFAKREMDRGSIFYTVSHERKIKVCLQQLLQECERLNTDASIETSLLLYVGAFSLFDDYLDFLAMAEDVLIDEGYEGIYQLASFHPDYSFNESDGDDPANYTNRSPYPMLHLLRESSIDRAVSTYANTDAIPQRNMDLTRELGLAKMQALLASCYASD